MASIRVYGREVTITLDWQSPTDNSSLNKQISFRAHSFDDFRKYTIVSLAKLGGAGSIEVGRFFTVEVELPESAELMPIGTSDGKHIQLHDGTSMTVEPLMEKAYKNVDGYRIINITYESKAG
jgi:hypothetical protein